MDAYRQSFESGIPCQRILKYLAEELALESTGAGCFRYGSCLIRLSQLPPRRLGSFTLPRNELLLEGNRTDIESFISAFTLRFLSAGG